MRRPALLLRLVHRPASLRRLLNATRRVDVDGQVLTFGCEPVYVRAAELPPQLADDPKLWTEKVDSAPGRGGQRASQARAALRRF